MSSNFDTYAGFRSAVYTWLDCSSGDLNASIVDDMVRIGQRHIEKGCSIMMGGRVVYVPPLRCVDNEKEFGSGSGITIASSVAAVPTDYLEAKQAYTQVGSVIHKAERTETEELYRLNTDRSSSGNPIRFARHGSNFVFGPIPSGSTLFGTYYASFPDIAGTTLSLTDSNSADYNKLYAKNWNAYLFATLKECEPLLFRDQRAGMWAEKYYSVVMAAQESDKRERFSGSSLAVKTPYQPS